MMPVVLQDKLLPRQRKKVRKGVSKEALPLVHRESGSVHDVVINVNVLDGDVRERDAEAQSAGPPEVREASQSCAVADHHQHLSEENCGKNIPHVDHLLRRDLGEEECKVLRHWVWLVRSREEPIGLQAPVLVVLLNGQHLVAALSNTCRVRVPLAWKSVLQCCNFVVVLVFLRQFLKILICSIEDRCLAVGGFAQERGTCRHGHTGN
mmetsp:Transcript_43316/g.103243  ORF Transcript_43316/g.103243 Transcript_43316/m.103243 type:complete len:208 (+) Transcript_43316:541-1164(+)